MRLGGWDVFLRETSRTLCAKNITPAPSSHIKKHFAFILAFFTSGC